MSTPQTTSVLELLTRLEALLRGGGGRPGQRPPDGQEALGLVGMIRAALPAELSHGHRLRLEAEQIHRRAQDEARRIVLEAQATAQRRVDHGAIAPETGTRSQQQLAQAHREAREIRDGADAYAAKVLNDLEHSILRVLEAIRKGKQLLKDRSR
jgi:hypothetical protein